MEKYTMSGATQEALNILKLKKVDLKHFATLDEAVDYTQNIVDDYNIPMIVVDENGEVLKELAPMIEDAKVDDVMINDTECNDVTINDDEEYYYNLNCDIDNMDRIFAKEYNVEVSPEGVAKGTSQNIQEYVEKCLERQFDEDLLIPSSEDNGLVTDSAINDIAINGKIMVAFNDGHEFEIDYRGIKRFTDEKDGYMIYDANSNTVLYDFASGKYNKCIAKQFKISDSKTF